MSKAVPIGFEEPPPSYDASVGAPSYPSGPKQEPMQAAPVMVQPVAATVVMNFGKESADVTCPYCRATVKTEVKTEPSMKAWIAGAILCFVGCDCGCCLIPCCMESCMDVEHRCPNCNKFLGKYNC